MSEVIDHPNQPPNLPPNNPPPTPPASESEENLMYVLRIKEDADASTLRSRVETFLAQYYHDDIVSHIDTGIQREEADGCSNVLKSILTTSSTASSASANAQAHQGFKLEPLYQDILAQLSPQERNLFQLHKYYLLTLPHKRERFYKSTEPRGDGILHDFRYKMKNELNLQRVAVDVPYPGYETNVGYASALPPSEQPFASQSFSAQGAAMKKFMFPCSGSHQNWHLERVGLIDSQGNRSLTATGNSIRIGHPDTGWTRHSDLNFVGDDCQTIDFTKDKNVINGVNNAEEAIRGEIAIYEQPYHGTATGSVIISNPTQHLSSTNPAQQVHGIAPSAQLVPVRAVKTVILFSGVRVAQAILHLILCDVDVISISLGGVGSCFLESVIGLATARNIIVVCAAGNVVPLVAMPALYPDTIAVGGSNPDDKHWEGSARGEAVDITAPSSCIWRASWNWDTTTNQGQAVVEPAFGTSYATATTAGAAALWLETHGKTALINRLNGQARLTELFRAHLKSTSSTPDDWETRLFGAGILNIPALLNGDTLPTLADMPHRDWMRWRCSSALDLISRMLSVDPELISLTFKDVYNVLEDELEDLFQELVALFGKAQDALDAFIMDVVNKAHELGRDMIEVAQRIRDFLIDVSDKAEQVIDDFVAATADSIEEAQEIIEATAEDAWEFASDTFQRLTQRMPVVN